MCSKGCERKMELNFSIVNLDFKVNVSDEIAVKLLEDYSGWFSKNVSNEKRIINLIKREAEIIINTDTYLNLVNYFKLFSPTVIGKNNKLELLLSENNVLYLASFVNNIQIYVSFDLLKNVFNIYYSTSFEIFDIINLLKLLFILYLNHSLELRKKPNFILIHCCAMKKRNNNGAIFLGISNAGKTTIAQFGINNGFKILTDETAILWEKENDNNFYIQGTPWHGSEKIIVGSSEKIILESVFIIIKADKDYIEISNNSYENKNILINQLLSSSFFNNDKFYENINFISRISKTQIHKLYFTKSDKFLELIN